MEPPEQNCYNKTDMFTLRKFMEKINTKAGFLGELRYDEPMAPHTTFKVGGPADVWVRPAGAGFPVYAAALLGSARAEGIPVFILGGGANLVIADRGIRGIVLDTGGWAGWNFLPFKDTDPGGPRKSIMVVRSGSAVDAAVNAAAGEGLGGLEFLAGMPGSVGGAVWMNARCYERSVSGVLGKTEILDESLSFVRVPYKAEDFSYKKSPFQNRKVLILTASFTLVPRPKGEIRAEIKNHLGDRENKGHYRYPSAGSAFKNNRAFGKPAGKIIDELGLRGFSVGGAAVAPFHGNIVINTGNAGASDIRALMEAVSARVKAALGFDLEPEVLFAGDWNGENAGDLS
jgi:UDP-N-acetylmuramate dehydrogenase